MIFIYNFLLTASTPLFLLGTFCRRDGGCAFESVGRVTGGSPSFVTFSVGREGVFLTSSLNRKINNQQLLDWSSRLHLLLSVPSLALGSNSTHSLPITVLAMFYGCHRSGELIFKGSKTTLDYRKIIKRGSLHFHGDHAGYRLPYHKADRFYRGSDILLSHHDIADPVFFLSLYTSLRDSCHGARAELFIREHGSLPSRRWFDNHFFSVRSREYGGHSVRAGSATYFASLGVSETIIQALGRWSSEAWKILHLCEPLFGSDSLLRVFSASLCVLLHPLPLFHPFHLRPPPHTSWIAQPLALFHPIYTFRREASLASPS
ncbi:hypothetical protein EV361DRAFT_834467 [Lentinula raphanica]|uniref:Uncharacterized protein n=1 Tax=Lentinula raphanica TaxID=153919 RepID=A0AA38P0S6_9AGAR|nr:hypothetical protein F5878DRAFT_373205 [Lentinula raphanica]KAJ3964868.1 hypothetical protein EV361DRAFT_834467 [Lentinula raphanica]